MERAPDQVLADWLADAQALRRTGHAHDAELIETVIRSMRQAFEPFLTWLNEDDAMRQSGEPARFFKRNRLRWAAQGFARKERRTWYYLQAIVPRRTHRSAVIEDAKREARAAATS